MGTEYIDHILIPKVVLALLVEIEECFYNNLTESSILSDDLFELTQKCMAKVLRYELSHGEYSRRTKDLPHAESLAALAWLILMFRGKQLELEELKMALSI